MGESMDKLIKAIKHYQDSLERHTKTGNGEKLLHAIEKLARLPIKVCHLEETGVGRTVNGLKKFEGSVGDNARTLVDKWKTMVKGEEDEEQARMEQERRQAENIGNEVVDEELDPESLHIVDQEENGESDKSISVEPNNSSHKKSISSIKNSHSSSSSSIHNKRSGSQDRHDKKSKRQRSSDDSDNNNSDSDSDNKLKRHKSEKNDKISSQKNYSDKESDSESESDESDSSRESSPKRTKNKKSKRSSSESSDKSSDDSEQNSSEDSSSDRGIKEIKSKTNKHKKRDSSASESEDGSKYSNDRYEKQSSKHKKSGSESDRDHKHKSNKSKEKKDFKPREKPKDSYSKSNNKSDKRDKDRESSSKRDSSSSKSKSKFIESESKHKKEDSYDREKSRNHDKDSKKSSSKTKENKKEESKTESLKSHKEKDDKRSQDKKRRGESSADNSAKRHKGEFSDSKDAKNKIYEHSGSSKSEEKKGGSNKKEKDRSETEKTKKSSDSSSKSLKEKNKPKTAAHNNSVKKLVDGIDSGSGTSFADVLGMLEAPVYSKGKKKNAAPEEKHSSDKSYKEDRPSKSRSSTEALSSKKDNDEVPTLLKDPVNLEPLDINISSLLPSITPNYRPLGMSLDNLNRKMWSDDEALSRVISAKHQRTKVYSGNKSGYTKVPTLFDICSRILQDNLDALEYTGGVPYSILKPILEKANPDQLYQLEFHNPYLIEDTDELWQLHCQKEFRNKKREELESWREMYMRCLDEREAKLKALTANIKQSQDKSIPVRQTKLAYVDSVVKPPRNVARKQAKNGTAVDIKRPSQTPTERLNQLAKSGEAAKVAVPNPGRAAVDRSTSSSSSSHSSHIKPKKAPLMAKTLSLLKNRFGRR